MPADRIVHQPIGQLGQMMESHPSQEESEPTWENLRLTPRSSSNN